MITTTDQLGNTFNFETIPTRIISIVPSQTEFLFDIGLEEQIVGLTKFCIHPEDKVEKKINVGGTKNLSIENILSLKPDLIIANKEENTQDQIDELAKLVPVWISDIYTLDDAYEMMSRLGELFQKQEQTNKIIEGIKTSFAELEANLKPTHERIAYFIWRNPTMLAGTHTFIDHLLSKIGYYNICQDLPETVGSRYPTILIDEISKLNPDRLFLSSEPFPFNEKHIEELGMMWPQVKVQLVDGEMFSWYGSRLLKSADYFKNLLETK